MDIANWYNLAFGDKYGNTDEIDHLVITNNGDSHKVLATVVATVYIFTDRHPEACIFATGSTPARTRLYRIGISNNIRKIRKDFEVYGLYKNVNGYRLWHKFRKGENYEAFLVKRKKM